MSMFVHLKATDSIGEYYVNVGVVCMSSWSL